MVGVIKDYYMSILYHLSKANVVADALSIMSMCSTSHIEECIKELAKDIHHLSQLRVRIMDSNQ